MPVDGKLPIHLELNVDMINVVLTALSQQPYEKVAQIISFIQQQASKQIDIAQGMPTEVEAANG